MNDHKAYPAGTIQSLTYSPGIGWDFIWGGQGLPPNMGFGFSGSLDMLADKVQAECTQPVTKWNSLTESVPELRICTLRDLRQLSDILDIEFGLKIVFDARQMPLEVGGR